LEGTQDEATVDWWRARDEGKINTPLDEEVISRNRGKEEFTFSNTRS